jgi:glycosyltransferase involved in cell wall biosynthesis
LLIKNKIDDNVVLKKSVDHNQIPNELASSKIGLIVINQHSLFGYQIPTKTYEYIAVGLPIVAMGPTEGELRNLIEDNEIGFYSDNQKDLTENIIRILEDEKIWRKFHSNSLKLAKKYSRKYIVQEAYHKYIKNLLKEDKFK